MRWKKKEWKILEERQELQTIQCKKYLVILNFTSATTKANTGVDLSKAKALINNYDKPAAGGSLKPYEAVVYEL